MASATAVAPRRSTTGLDLKLRRVAAFVTQAELASTLGVSRQRVTSLEAEGRPAPTAVARYLAALEQLVNGQEPTHV